MVNQFLFKRTVIYLEYQISKLDDAILFLTVNINVCTENQVYRSFFSHFMEKKISKRDVSCLLGSFCFNKNCC